MGSTEDQPELPRSPAVVAALVENHREFLAFLQRRVHDRATAEDILQEAFARGLDRLETLQNDESVRAWFYRTLRNAVVDHYRRRQASDNRLSQLAAELEAETPPEEIERTVCQCVKQLATTLKPEYAEALERIEVDGISVKEFAEKTGISPSNAAVRVFRAREALRKQVEASCRTCAEHGCVDCTCKK
jgi:RNA polymerase sigma-70 factor (ECF subfamily)